MMRNFGRKVRDMWIYFKAGHGGYLVYSMSIMNFVVLQHRLLIQYVPFLDKYLNKLSTFVALFFLTYIPLAVLMGYFEFRKGEMTRKPMLNPYIRDRNEATILQSESLQSYYDGDMDMAKAKIEKSIFVMRKWRKTR
ncbi:hypothetical protein CL673_02645 [Candidatus Bathyarchaeota archaeon]|jgi:hypothetical protein|nr:hypothetical protein [Candidatus Bathyarchaeota archaeon]MDP6048479.1 hypothetical protein [Candidatus Bathyarchaeota archaeon]|tara:strand:- start:232 stop:642 length:411 start_codon:yes stop_codon:yes gene_type:complete